jgi:hypothetical protein
MKKLISILSIFFVSVTGKTQTPIDYSNFNVELASKIMGDVFLKFRDTINCFSGGEPFTVSYPAIGLYPELKKPRWSDYLYKKVSEPNCKELSSYGNKAFHIDREEWFKTNITEIREEYYKGIPNVPKYRLENARLSYSENVFSYNGKFNTYEELASYAIKCWEKSTLHRCAQRGLMYDTFSYDEYGLRIQDIFSTCVMYNPSNGCTKIVINFIE